MKFTRSFWLGLGSGLILSAMLVLIFSPQSTKLNTQSIVNSQTTNDPETKRTDQEPASQPSDSKESNKSTSNQMLPSNLETPPIDRDFVIPKGASAEKIAELLLDQGFVKDKETFLNDVHQMGVERRFQAGTFKLAVGLTGEELIKRLLK